MIDHCPVCKSVLRIKDRDEFNSYLICDTPNKVERHSFNYLFNVENKKMYSIHWDADSFYFGYQFDVFSMIIFNSTIDGEDTEINYPNLRILNIVADKPIIKIIEKYKKRMFKMSNFK